MVSPPSLDPFLSFASAGNLKVNGSASLLRHPHCVNLESGDKFAPSAAYFGLTVGFSLLALCGVFFYWKEPQLFWVSVVRKVVAGDAGPIRSG